jgi:hypothetical protein
MPRSVEAWVGEDVEDARLSRVHHQQIVVLQNAKVVRRKWISEAA